MGKLINPERQAQARQARLQRMAALEAAAVAEFSTAAYGDVTLDGVGLKAGVPAGTASLYFGSREALFLRAFATQVKEWCLALAAELERAGKLDARQTALLLARSFASCQALPRMIYLLPFALEHAREEAGLTVLVAGLKKPLGEVARRLEACSPVAAARGGGALLAELATLVALVAPRTVPRGGLTLALTEPALARYRGEFEEELERRLVAWLESATGS